MSNLNDFLSSTSSGVSQTITEITNATGTILLSGNSNYKVVQGEGDLTITFDNDSNETVKRGLLYLERNLDFAISIDADLSDETKEILATEYYWTNKAFPIQQFNVYNSLQSNEDGTELFLVRGGTSFVKSMKLEAPFQAIGGAFTDLNFEYDIGSTRDATAIRFTPLGDEIFVLGDDGLMWKYALGTNYDVTTKGAQTGFDGLNGTDTTDFVLSSDGTRIYVIDISIPRFWEHVLGTPYDLNNVVSSTFKDIDDYGIVSIAGSLAITSDDSTLLLPDNGSKIYKIKFGTPLDISTSFSDGYIDATNLQNIQAIYLTDDDSTLLVKEQSAPARLAEYKHTKNLTFNLNQYGTYTSLSIEGFVDV